MNSDPFFEIDVATAADKELYMVDSLLLGFFVCSFDHTRGVQILYSYPLKLKSDFNELNILRTHCIWKMERIPLRIDLKFSEFIYSAFQLDYPNHEDVSNHETVPQFITIVKLWKAGKKIPSRIFLELKTKLEKEYHNDLNLLYKRSELALNPIKKREFKELSKPVREIENKLLTLWREFESQVDDYKAPANDRMQVETSSEISSKEDVCTPNLFKKKIDMRTFTLEEDTNRLMVVLTNQWQNLEDVRIHISKNTDFFSETHWQQRLDEWPFKEELILEFSKSDVVQNFLIKISSNKTTIAILSLEVSSSVNFIPIEKHPQD
ncbi:MAG: hypothetical protein ACFE95_16240 [Candidatus Hodarchaeota archaeon]